jgi:hypothetical protein
MRFAPNYAHLIILHVNTLIILVTSRNYEAPCGIFSNFNFFVISCD